MGALYHAEQLNWEITRAILRLAKRKRHSAHAIARQVYGQLNNSDAKKRSENSIYRSILYLKSRGFLKLDQQKTISATSAGSRRLRQMAANTSRLSLARGQKWDGLWRIVIFDIPEQKRSARDALRRVIKHLGFVQLQRSVWVHPLPCKQYIKEVQDAYGVHDHIVYIEAKGLTLPGAIKKTFASITKNKA